jgi:chitodextrinase
MSAERIHPARAGRIGTIPRAIAPRAGASERAALAAEANPPRSALEEYLCVALTENATTATVAGLTPATTYSFTVKARDASGNASAASAAVSAAVYFDKVVVTQE